MPVTTETYPWLKYYPKGVPYEINPEAYPSILELMEDGFNKFSHKSAYACMGKEITYGQLDTLSRNFAAYLQSIGMEKGNP